MAVYGRILKTMNKPNIIAYLKPSCGWSNGVRAVLKKYDLPYEDRDIINDPAQRQEMIEKSGQMLSPCVEIDGRLLVDITGGTVTNKGIAYARSAFRQTVQYAITLALRYDTSS